MGFGGISIWSLLLVLAIVILLFGTKKLRNVGGDLGKREPHPSHARHLVEERVVAAGGLGAALDHVARGDGAGE